MSTDIVRWSNNTKEFQSGALYVYLALCIPFMFATFIFWAVFQWRERRIEDFQTNQAREDLTQP